LSVRVGVQDRNEGGRLGRDLSTKRIAGHETGKRLPQVLPVSFVGKKEKSLVVFDRSAHRRSELIHVERRLLGIQGVNGFAGVEHVVADKFKNIAMELICARGRSNCQLSSSSSSRLRGR